VALAVDARDRVIRRLELGPANLRLVSDSDLERMLRQIARETPSPAAVAIGLAGARTPANFDRIRRLEERTWPGVPCCATNDLETGLAAAPGYLTRQRARVLVLSGTGSCCYGKSKDGLAVKVGGWGHVLGDQGSGYDMGLLALKTVLAEWDASGRWPALGTQILRALALNEPDDLVDWAQTASKADIATLAGEVMSSAQNRDRLAIRVFQTVAMRLAEMAVACAERLGAGSGGAEFVFAGGLLLKQPKFARCVQAAVSRDFKRATFLSLERESVWGAVQLARQAMGCSGVGMISEADVRNIDGSVGSAIDRKPDALGRTDVSEATTEQRNPASRDLDRLPLRHAIRLMLDEESLANRAVLAEAGKIERVIQRVVRAFRHKGRLFYVGAGTSGRLGVLDASECPPTFRTPPDMVQGIMAGGQRALWQSVEGAEDNASAGKSAIRSRGVRREDVVLGIAASGRTPFVLGALREARRMGALTVLLTFNQRLALAPEDRPWLIVSPGTGPEVLTGSTRLKAGTATKLVLNLITTLSMVRLGKVVSNLMIDVLPANMKLQDRAVRILCALSGLEYEEARQALEQNQWIIETAWRRLQRKGILASHRIQQNRRPASSRDRIVRSGEQKARGRVLARRGTSDIRVGSQSQHTK